MGHAGSGRTAPPCSFCYCSRDNRKFHPTRLLVNAPEGDHFTQGSQGSTDLPEGAVLFPADSTTQHSPGTAPQRFLPPCTLQLPSLSRASLRPPGPPSGTASYQLRPIGRLNYLCISSFSHLWPKLVTSCPICCSQLFECCSSSCHTLLSPRF